MPVTVRRRTMVSTALLIAAIACAPAAEDDREGTDADEAGMMSAIPAALLGDGAAPSGTAIHYMPGDTATTGYLAVPEGDGPFPAVVLIHEWNGLVDRVRQVADAMAAEGYLALAVDLYRGQVGTSPDENRALMASVEPDAIIANLNQAVTVLRERDDVTGKVATMGWCYGGGVALSYAVGGEQHDGTAIFYGRLVEDPEQLRRIDHEIYGTFAAEDQGIPPDQVERFATALRDIGIDNDIHVYDAVAHGFWLYVERDREDAEPAATDAWERLKAYLDRTVG